MSSEAWRERFQPDVDEPQSQDELITILLEQRQLWLDARTEQETRRERQAMTNIEYLLGYLVTANEMTKSFLV